MASFFDTIAEWSPWVGLAGGGALAALEGLQRAAVARQTERTRQDMRTQAAQLQAMPVPTFYDKSAESEAIRRALVRANLRGVGESAGEIGQEVIAQDAPHRMAALQAQAMWDLSRRAQIAGLLGQTPTSPQFPSGAGNFIQMMMQLPGALQALRELRGRSQGQGGGLVAPGSPGVPSRFTLGGPAPRLTRSLDMLDLPLSTGTGAGEDPWTAFAAGGGGEGM